MALALTIGGAILALIGVAIGAAVTPWGWSLVVVGGLIEVSGPLLHDRRHRAAGEAPHAMWGEDDRHKPTWLAKP